TLGERGSVIVSGAEPHEIPCYPAEVVDTTGAADLYAAGVLYGYTAGRPLAERGRLGAMAAAEVIGHTGARPEIKLSTLIDKLSPPTRSAPGTLGDAPSAEGSARRARGAQSPR